MSVSPYAAFPPWQEAEMSLADEVAEEGAATGESGGELKADESSVE